MKSEIVWKKDNYVLIKGDKNSSFTIDFKEKLGIKSNTNYSVKHRLNDGFSFSPDGILTGVVDGSSGTIIVNEESSGVSNEHSFIYSTRKPMKRLLILGLIALAVLILTMLFWNAEMNKIWGQENKPKNNVSGQASTKSSDPKVHVKTSYGKEKDYKSKKIMLRYVVDNLKDSSLEKNNKHVLEVFYGIGEYKEEYYMNKYSGINVDDRFRNVFYKDFNPNSNLRPRNEEKELFRHQKELNEYARRNSINLIQKKNADAQEFWLKSKKCIDHYHKQNVKHVDKLIRKVDALLSSTKDKDIDKYVGDLTSIGTTFRTIGDKIGGLWDSLFGGKKSKNSNKQTQLEKDLRQSFNKYVLDEKKLNRLIEDGIDDIENKMKSSRGKIISKIDGDLTSKNLKKMSKVVVEKKVEDIVKKLVKTGELASITNIPTGIASLTIGGLLGDIVSQGLVAILPKLADFLVTKGLSGSIAGALGAGGTAVAPGVGTAIGIVAGLGIGIGVDLVIGHFQKNRIKSNLKEGLKKMRIEVVKKLDEDLNTFIKAYNSHESKDFEDNIKDLIKEENTSIDEELNHYLGHMEVICEKTIINPIFSF